MAAFSKMPKSTAAKHLRVESNLSNHVKTSMSIIDTISELAADCDGINEVERLTLVPDQHLRHSKKSFIREPAQLPSPQTKPLLRSCIDSDNELNIFSRQLISKSVSPQRSQRLSSNNGNERTCLPTWISHILDVAKHGSVEQLNNLLVDVEPSSMRQLCNEDGNKLLHIICANNQSHLLPVVASKVSEEWMMGGLMDKNNAGITPLGIAIEKGFLDCLRPIFDTNSLPHLVMACLSQIDLKGRSLLHLAVASEKLEVLLWLLATVQRFTMPDENIVPDLSGRAKKALLSGDVDGNTALHHAAEQGFLEALVELLAFGCRPYLKNNAGLRASDIASVRGHRGCVEYLILYETSLEQKSSSEITLNLTQELHDERVLMAEELQNLYDDVCGVNYPNNENINLKNYTASLKRDLGDFIFRWFGPSQSKHKQDLKKLIASLKMDLQFSIRLAENRRHAVKSQGSYKVERRKLATPPIGSVGTATVIEVIEPTSSEEDDFKRCMRDLNISWPGMLDDSPPRLTPTKKLLQMGISTKSVSGLQKAVNHAEEHILPDLFGARISPQGGVYDKAWYDGVEDAPLSPADDSAVSTSDQILTDSLAEIISARSSSEEDEVFS